jgi:nucleoside-diphosphate-sugar epimerase
MQVKSLIGKKILLTGASGFIGEHVYSALFALGAQVYGVSRKKQEKNEKIMWSQADLSKQEDVERVVSLVKPDIIIHLAGEVTGSRDMSVVRPTFKNIATSALNLLEIVTQKNIKRLILVGSMEESVGGNEMPGSPYSAAKMTASLYAKLFYTLYKTPVVTLRLFMVYGPNQKDASKIIPYTINSILDSKSLSFSSGRRKVDWIYIDDVVRAIVASVSANGIEGKTIDIGTGVYTSIRDVIKTVASKMKYNENLGFGKLPDRIFEKETKANINLAEMYLRWKAQIVISVGLEKTIKWHRKAKSLIL